uniref:Uncharacterized protein n=1 Tax=Oryza sativa subsp. japonica TaxID=39947 RepID=Q8LIJ6_ORYSJ|nr:hypothetical protein [Oryza sativa Japonica Group]
MPARARALTTTSLTWRARATTYVLRTAHPYTRTVQSVHALQPYYSLHNTPTVTTPTPAAGTIQSNHNHPAAVNHPRTQPNQRCRALCRSLECARDRRRSTDRSVRRRVAARARMQIEQGQRAQAQLITGKQPDHLRCTLRCGRARAAGCLTDDLPALAWAAPCDGRVGGRLVGSVGSARGCVLRLLCISVTN